MRAGLGTRSISSRTWSTRFRCGSGCRRGCRSTGSGSGAEDLFAAEPGRDPSQQIGLVWGDRRTTCRDSGKGQVFYRCPAEEEGAGRWRSMASRRRRGTLKCRRPATPYGLERGAGSGVGGFVMRFPQAGVPRRTEGPLPARVHADAIGRTVLEVRRRPTRSAVERMNSRLDGVCRFERHIVRGGAKMKAWVGFAACLMVALAASSGCARWSGRRSPALAER